MNPSTPALGTFQPHASRTARFWSLVAAFVLAGTAAPLLLAQEMFEPPVPYSASRYQARWQQDLNPFNYVTAPAAVERRSFAEDLAIATYYGSKDHPTLVIVNTKTLERIALKQGVAAPNGIVLQSISLAPLRKDITAEVALGGEKAILKYDDSYLRQMAAPAGKGDPTGPTTAQAGSQGTVLRQNIGTTANPTGEQPVGGPPVRRPILVPRTDGTPYSAPGGSPAMANPSGPKLPKVPDRTTRRTNTAPTFARPQPLGSSPGVTTP